MSGTYFWNKFYLHRYKVVITLLLIACAFSGEAQRTRWVRKNNPNYDDKKLTYGFLIGLHTTAYQVKYSDAFVTQKFDTVHSIVPEWKNGFSLGFIVNYKIADFFDLRLTPTVAFYEYTLRYIYTDNTPTDVQPIETTMVEFPLLLKYKSERRDNIRMYMIGGIKPGFEASGKKAIENSSTSGVKVKGTNLCLEAGFGFDLYYPLFKFSPEIRFSRGVVNMLENTTNKYGEPLQRLNTNTITLLLLFQ